MNFYPFHVGDYLLRTAHLEPLEDLAYRRLLDLYYVNEQPIAGTPAEVARIIRLRSAVPEVEGVLREFFIETPGGWQHSHCDEVIQQYQAKAKVAAENGKRGGRPRKNPAPIENNQPGSDPQTKAEPEETQPVNSANPAETGSKTNQEPITNNQEPKVKHTPTPPSAAAIGFDEFWSAYPLKKAKATAEKAWAKLKPNAELGATILSAIATHRASIEWQRDGGQYIPHPTTWLNQRRWEDEVTHASSQQTGRKGPRSAVDDVKQAIAYREAQSALAGQALAEDGGAVREPLDGEFRRVG